MYPTGSRCGNTVETLLLQADYLLAYVDPGHRSGNLMYRASLIKLTVILYFDPIQ